MSPEAMPPIMAKIADVVETLLSEKKELTEKVRKVEADNELLRKQVAEIRVELLRLRDKYRRRRNDEDTESDP